MPDEIDLPCTDRGSALQEHVVSLSELLQSASSAGRVTLAACPRCSATYYPEDALSTLSRFHTSRSRGAEL